MGLVLTTPLLLIDWRPLSARAWLLMVASGMCFGVAQYLPDARLPRGAGGPAGSVHLHPDRAGSALGVILFGTVPDPWAGIGTAIVIGAGLYVLRRRHAS